MVPTPRGNQSTLANETYRYQPTGMSVLPFDEVVAESLRYNLIFIIISRFYSNYSRFFVVIVFKNTFLYKFRSTLSDSSQSCDSK